MIVLILIIAIIVFFVYGLIKILIASIGGIGKSLFGEDETNVEVIDNTQAEPLKVEIKNSKFDTSKIEEYTGEGIKSYNWQPQSFSQFIGQSFSKEQGKTIIKKMKKGMKAHCILSAIQGHGKSTYIRLLAKSLGAKLIEVVGKQLDDPEELVNILNIINTCPEEYVVFFLDEIDSCDWKILKLLNPILQDGQINGKTLKPLLFASATINKDLLLKKNPDLLDRIPHHIQFSRYTPEELGIIISQYKNNLYPDENLPEEIIKTIATSCKYNPRLALGIMEDFIIEQNIKKVLKNRKIVKDGLTDLDIRVLKVLNGAIKPMGANSLSQRVGLTQGQYLRDIEPFLAEFEYLKRIPSRVIGEKGKQLLEEIK